LILDYLPYYLSLAYISKTNKNLYLCRNCLQIGQLDFSMAIGQGNDNGTHQQTVLPGKGAGSLSSRLSVEFLMDSQESGKTTSDHNGGNLNVEAPQDRSDLSSSPVYTTERLAEYELSSQLGDGAYGTVLLANHKRTNQTVAIKRYINYLS
jgi:hypothetical protein